MTQAAKNTVKKKSSRERIIEAARNLFGSKGFHATTTAELTAEAKVSIAQVYRLFESKHDIVIAIVEQRMNANLAEIHDIFESVKRGEVSAADAIKALIAYSLNDPESGLVFEILAESYRNPSVAERLATLVTFHRDGIRRLATLANPDSSPSQLDAYVTLVSACLTGLFYHRPVTKAKSDEMNHNVTCLMLRALGLEDQALV